LEGEANRRTRSSATVYGMCELQRVISLKTLCSDTKTRTPFVNHREMSASDYVITFSFTAHKLVGNNFLENELSASFVILLKRTMHLRTCETRETQLTVIGGLFLKI
jgi:hypothetical protein